MTGITQAIPKLVPNISGSIILIIIIVIVLYLISVMITLVIIRLTLCFPPIRHLAQSIIEKISNRD